MLGRRPEPGGHQQRAELVTVQRDGMRFIVQPRPPHVDSRGMLEELLFDRVLAGPGDGAQPPGDGGARSPSCFQVACEALDVAAADREQAQGAGAAPGGELAQVLARMPRGSGRGSRPGTRQAQDARHR